MRYWINTVSRDHVRVGMAGGFTQANHGLRRGMFEIPEEDFNRIARAMDARL